jgi:putative NIF3 family GTP cyclohydrolase 1 type 2
MTQRYFSIKYLNNCLGLNIKQTLQLIQMENNDRLDDLFLQRRKFIKNISLTAAGAGILLSSPFAAGAANKKTWTVGQIMDLFLKEVNGAPFPSTVDTLKSGSKDTQVKGIVTTMFATVPVIKQAIAAGANFIIAHEPTFYSHLDKTDWLKDDGVYHYKSDLLNKNNITVWRNHDYIHAHRPDGVYSGLLKKLGWNKYADLSSPWNVQLPETSLSELISSLKRNLNISTLRYIGDDGQRCKKILLMPGAAGGQRQISSISEMNPDVAIVGEISEWETAEYVRDARASGKKLSLIVLGHIDSEDPGSEFMKEWLNKNVAGVPVTHIYCGSPFSFK